MISATVVADSVSEATGHRLTSLELVAHRFILAEINTHCAFERNSASTRAIPLHKQLSRYITSPALPASLPAEKSGMSGGNELEGADRIDAETLLERLHAFAGTAVTEYLADHQHAPTRLHKSVVARYLEPFQWHRMILTGSAWENFFAQRCSPDAQPEFQVLAHMIRNALDESTPVPLVRGEWHMPYLRPGERLGGADPRKVSAARCARVSYLGQDADRRPQDDEALCDRLVEQMHWSPLAHVATPDQDNVQTVPILDPDHEDMTIAIRRVPVVGKWAGWQQYRHIVEARVDYDSMSYSVCPLQVSEL